MCSHSTDSTSAHLIFYQTESRMSGYGPTFHNRMAFMAFCSPACYYITACRWCNRSSCDHNSSAYWNGWFQRVGDCQGDPVWRSLVGYRVFVGVVEERHATEFLSIKRLFARRSGQFSSLCGGELYKTEPLQCHGPVNRWSLTFSQLFTSIAHWVSLFHLIVSDFTCLVVNAVRFIDW